MSLKNRLYFLSVFACFLLPFGTLAQDTSEKQPLYAILDQVQKQYHCQFNYAEDTIEHIEAFPPQTRLSLNEVLGYLQQQTGLVFTLLENNFVSVKKQDRLTVCGYLKSRDNELPIGSATVLSGKGHTVTDINGFFRLTINDPTDMITIRHLGFQTVSVPFMDIKADACEDIYLDQGVQSLSEVVIADYIISGINKLNNGTYELDFSNFEILPGLVEADVLQSVQAFPGIQSENETVSNINIRGGTHDQNLILWDDIKMYQSGHFFGLISMFNPQITKKVSLLKNGTDVRYTDGTSGTILMKTEQEVNSGFNGNIGVNFIDANGFVDVPIGARSSIQIAARKAISDFVQTPSYKQFFERISQNTEVEDNPGNSINTDKQFDFYDASLRWIYKVGPKDEIRINFINVANELAFDENAAIDGVEETRQSKVSQNSIAVGLQYNRTWDNKWQTNVTIYESDYKLKARNANILDSQRFLQENKVSETSIKLNAFYAIDNRFQLLNGYQFVETGITNLDDVDNPLFHLLVSEVVRTHAVYSQLNYVSIDRTTNFNAGARFNYIDKFQKIIVEPRLNFNQRFLEHFTFEVLGEFKHQNTSQVINFQSDFLGIEKRRWQLSNNSDIPVIESKQISAGINYSHHGLLISVEGYLKKVEGITTQSQGFQNQYEFVKTKGSYRARGLDVLLRKRLDNFSTWLSYSLMDNQYTFNELQEKQFPSNLDIEHNITFGLAYTTDHLKIATGVNWHSGKPTTNPFEHNVIVDGEINYEPANSSRLDSYFRVDVSALYDFAMSKNTKGILGVSVWNLLNNDNIINSTYRLINNDSQLVQQNSLGFTPNFVFRMYF